MNAAVFIDFCKRLLHDAPGPVYLVGNDGDVMTRDGITAGPRTPFKEIVDRLVGAGISALPVVDDHGAVLGVVSEADLLRPIHRRSPGPAPASSGARPPGSPPPTS